MAGALDTSFGTSGVALVVLTDVDEGHGVDVQPDGKIVVVGYTWASGAVLAARPLPE